MVKLETMRQEKINYRDIIDLGFNENECSDSVYFNQYGYAYCIITLDLTKEISLDWAKETQLCKMIRVDNDKDCNVIKEMPIKDLNHLKEIVYFFSDEKEQDYNYATAG